MKIQTEKSWLTYIISEKIYFKTKQMLPEVNSDILYIRYIIQCMLYIYIRYNNCKSKPCKVNNAKKKRKTIEWYRLEISSRKLETPREHFKQR